MKGRVLLTAFSLVTSTFLPAAFARGVPAQGTPSSAATDSEPSSGIHVFRARGAEDGREKLVAKLSPTGHLYFHGGPVILAAHVVYIFWGPSFNDTNSPDHSYALELQSFRNQLGTTAEYQTITQYSGSNGTVALTNLGAGSADWFDTSTPPTNVTDAIAQGEVTAYLATHTFDDSTIYEVVLPSASYSTMSNGWNSCGGPNTVQFCAYHGYFTSNSNSVKYSVQPYPCSICATSGFSDVKNQEHFVAHETREAVTDPLINAWYDTNGYEADDQCAWTPTPFIGTGGYAYQAEWSNALNACTASTPNPNHEGYHEAANCRAISGWAWDKTQPTTRINVDISKDSTLFTNLAANLFRSDLYSAGKGDGYHAFSYTPSAAWKDGQWHSARVRFGGTSTSLTWSPISFICSVKMFPSLLPQDDLSTGGQVYTVATQLSSSQNGYITQLGFYRGAGETGTNTLRLWTDGGTQLASVTPSCGASGWCWGSITPVAITANTLYRVSVNTNTFQSKTNCGIGSGITNQVLTAHQGFWIAGDTFPTTGSCSNFFVDVSFDM